jgi:hypothetical protein
MLLKELQNMGYMYQSILPSFSFSGKKNAYATLKLCFVETMNAMHQNHSTSHCAYNHAITANKLAIMAPAPTRLRPRLSAAAPFDGSEAAEPEFCEPVGFVDEPLPV